MYNLWTSLTNLWWYLPTVWADRQWDFSFTLAMLERKLTRQHRVLSDPSKNMAIHTRKELRKLKTAQCLAKRLCDGNHTDLAGYNVLVAKYGKRSFNKIFTGEPETKKERAVWMQWALDTQRLENQDWNMLWDTIKKHGRTWWD